MQTAICAGRCATLAASGWCMQHSALLGEETGRPGRAKCHWASFLCSVLADPVFALCLAALIPGDAVAGDGRGGGCQRAVLRCAALCCVVLHCSAAPALGHSHCPHDCRCSHRAVADCDLAGGRALGALPCLHRRNEPHTSNILTKLHTAHMLSAVHMPAWACHSVGLLRSSNLLLEAQRPCWCQFEGLRAH
jgi:hypothetical protein